MSKRLWIILGVIAAVLVGFLLFRGEDQNTNNGQASDATHVRGNADSSVVLTEYADFQCPYCAAYYPIVEQVVEKYQDQIKFEFRNLPLSSTHPNAFAAARAAEAANIQNEEAYWGMVGLLFENQNSWSGSNNPQAIFEQYAQQLNLDVAKFKEDSASSLVNDRINADVASFNATGEEMGTPAFFLNGERIAMSEGTLEEFSQYIDEALAKAAETNNQQNSADSTENAQ